MLYPVLHTRKFPHKNGSALRGHNHERSESMYTLMARKDK